MNTQTPSSGQEVHSNLVSPASSINRYMHRPTARRLSLEINDHTITFFVLCVMCVVFVDCD